MNSNMSFWDSFYDEIDGKEFATREEYEECVKSWVDCVEMELGRLERWALALGDGDATEELSIKIGGNKE